jgi:hypothetical protein
MRASALAVLVATGLALSACSENTSTPTESRARSDGLASADGPCVNSATIILPTIPDVPRNTTKKALFKLQNNCNNTSSSWEIATTVSVSRAGQW